MNTPVRRVSIAVMVMILMLMANLTYVQVVKAGDYAGDDRNQRKLLAEYSRQRGQISAGGEVLARSIPSGDRLEFQREYPDPQVFAPLTGYYSVNRAASGIEDTENDVLIGDDPRLFGRRMADLITGRDPRGGNVVLTIDPDLQRVAYNQLQSKGYTGSVVALQPRTGEILAMASTPSYDPNLLATHNAEAEAAAAEELNSADPPVLRNRAISETYPPGSTFKLIDVAAALSSGNFTPDSQLTAASSITLENTSTQLGNFNGNACGTSPTVSLREALQRSCNTAFAELSTQLGEDALREQAEAFGVDTEPEAIPLAVEQSGLGDIPDAPSLQQSSIGQRDVAFTPLQNAMVVAAIANGGDVMVPHLVKEIQDQELRPVETTEPDRLGQAVDGRVADTLTELMVNNENSYSSRGKISGVQIAAKTGTAEHGATPKTTAPHVWYVAFAPAEDPQVAVAVLVESGGDRNNLAATGGEVAAPIGRAVIASALGRAAR